MTLISSDRLLPQLLGWSILLIEHVFRNRLRLLNLNDNGLTVLPASIGDLLQLQELSLDGNRLTTLPRYKGWCQLSLVSNRLTANVQGSS